MIINFDEFLKEFHSYAGPNTTLGFRYSEPSNLFTLTFKVKYNEKTEDIIKTILDKYSIPYKDIKIDIEYLRAIFNIAKKPYYQKIKIDFLSYSGNEAYSIIDTFFKELYKSGVSFNQKDAFISPDILQHKKQFLGYRK